MEEKTMFKTYLKKVNLSWNMLALIVTAHIIIIALSNWLVQFPQNILGIKFTWAMFIFPLIVVVTDLTVRLSNQYNARLITGIAYIPAIIISSVLADWRIGVASGTAYLLGQMMDIFVFQRIREKFSAWYAAPLIATLVSNIIDTYIFFAVAFTGSSNPFMAQHWFSIATTDLFFKSIVSYIVILPFYGVVLNYALKKQKPSSDFQNH